MRYKALPISVRGVTPAELIEKHRNTNPRRLPDWLTTLAKLAVIPALLLAALPAIAIGPNLSASTSTVSAGDRVRILGADFPPGDVGLLTWDGETTGAPDYRVTHTGSFKVSIRIPPDAAPGVHVLSAVSESSPGDPIAALDLTISEPMPAPTDTPQPTPDPTDTPRPTPDPTDTPLPTPAPTDTPQPTDIPAGTPPAPTPSQVPAGPDRLTCTGYPEPRIFVESQSWWMQTPGANGTQFGHMHVGACMPYHQTLTGIVGIDVRIILHDNPGTFDYVNPVLVSNSQELSLPHVLTLNGLTCPEGTCTSWVHLDVDTRLIVNDGLEELRVRAYTVEPDGNIMHSSINTVAYFDNGYPLSNLDRRAYQRGKGWYTGAGYCESDVLSDLPVGPVSGTWMPQLQIVDHGAADDRPVTHSSVRLDPDFHATPIVPGTVLIDASVPWTGSVAIDTTTLTNGRHRLVLRADCDDPRGSTNSGVLVVFFTVAN
jgi:hypothetical protein